MNELQLREEICRVGASLYARGYVHASAGNISVRLADDAGYLITPTDACLASWTRPRWPRSTWTACSAAAPAPPKPWCCTAPFTAPSRRRAA